MPSWWDESIRWTSTKIVDIFSTLNFELDPLGSEAEIRKNNGDRNSWQTSMSGRYSAKILFALKPEILTWIGGLKVTFLSSTA